MLKTIETWLRDAPVSDDVDRRNAPVMQLLLFFYGIALPCSWAWHLSSRSIPPGWGIVLALDMATAALALASVAMIRCGHFRPAIKLFLGALLASMALAYHKLGTQAQLIDQTPMILVLAIGGLVLGRRALWMVYALVMAVFGIGFITDAHNTAQGPQWIRRALNNAPAVAVSYLIIAIVLDRTIAALRESLAESNARGRELQRQMAERERAQSQLVHAQKLEASGRLANGVAHDFNNILGVIQGFAAQRHGALDAGDDARRVALLVDALEGVEEAAGRGIALTRKLLGFSRNDALRIETFDAASALADLKPLLRQLFPPSVALELPAPGDTAPLDVRLDRSEFELMVLNIAANARDAMPDGGRFRAGVSAAAGGMVRIALSDSGCGMGEDVRRRVFEPFFSTKPAAVGTGLGLSVVHDLVKTLGGDIQVDSAPGQGTTVMVWLPSPEPLAAGR
ncbi:sensor histidine kinase [Vulcaniibacterium tengchongense]|uniref:histidine kinase n=1 Tax=Vulcaniibacterium tengchongense TaxID=1273429 RepID=A0A3N4VD98_9GAMM|nr:ATP-binding protein [Vulcaniibacterium tengchongense]RPE80976.1 histidine kinase/DNA gyrase B/HSP90-like ATPase [Vulcaniibacterium tengchongense]